MSFNPEEYDSWYDRHRDIFKAEIEAIRRCMQDCSGPMLEIGVGTGRFAHELGVDYGLDPDESMLELAKSRGIHTVVGVAESLPFSDRSMGTVLMLTSLPFFSHPGKAIAEAHRVLRNDGCLIIGFIPRDSYFGRKYTRMKDSGDARFSTARFHTFAEIKDMLGGLFRIESICSTLLGDEISKDVISEFSKDASFVVVKARKLSENF